MAQNTICIGMVCDTHTQSMSATPRHLVTPVTLLGFVDAEPSRARLVLAQPHTAKLQGDRVVTDPITPIIVITRSKSLITRTRGLS